NRCRLSAPKSTVAAPGSTQERSRLPEAASQSVKASAPDPVTATSLLSAENAREVITTLPPLGCGPPKVERMATRGPFQSQRVARPSLPPSTARSLPSGEKPIAPGFVLRSASGVPRSWGLDSSTDQK